MDFLEEKFGLLSGLCLSLDAVIPHGADKKISRKGKMKFAVNSPHFLRFISRILLYLQSKRIDHVYSSNGRLATFLVG